MTLRKKIPSETTKIIAYSNPEVLMKEKGRISHKGFPKRVVFASTHRREHTMTRIALFRISFNQFSQKGANRTVAPSEYMNRRAT